MGYRKPCAEGLKILAKTMQISTKEMVFVGDEEKDILCAANAGVYSILINRDGGIKNFGQDQEIDSLDKLLKMFE
nr:HAD-IA family hydrolase [Eubacterium sp.]